MKLIHISLLILLIIHLVTSCSKDKAVPSTVNGRIFYVDATNGSDSSSGTSENLAFQSLSKISSTTLQPGDAVYLKRGETWNESLEINQSGTLALPITVSSYGTGDFPVLDGGELITSTWVNVSGSIYETQVTITSASEEALGNVSENGSMLTFAAWNTNVATTFTGAVAGSFSFDYATNKLYVWTSDSSNPSLKTIKISKKIYGVNIEDNNYITIRNLTITRFSLHGIHFKNCTGCSVYNTTIDKTGGAVIATNSSAPPTYIYAGNGIEFGENSSSGIIQGVTISDIFDSCVSPQTYSSNKVISNMAFSDMTLNKCGYAGIEISVLSNGGNTGSSISDVSIENTAIGSTGKGWSGCRYSPECHGIRIKADTGAGTIDDVTTDNMVIVDDSAGYGIYVRGTGIGTINVNRTKISNNDLAGISFGDNTSTTMYLNLKNSIIANNAGNGLWFDSPNGQGFNLIQNTFYNNNVINLAINNQNTDANIVNNLFDSSADMTHLYVASTLVSGTVGSNCYRTGVNMIGYNNTAYSTLSSFTAATSLDASSLSAGNLLLTAISSNDFTPLSSSVCYHAGTVNYSEETDYLGNSYRNPPTIGALEEKPLGI